MGCSIEAPRRSQSAGRRIARDPLTLGRFKLLLHAQLLEWDVILHRAIL
jgi:hypothetical protein